MKTHRMVTVGGVYPASGKNTIRKLSQRYMGVAPGDQVLMVYVKDAALPQKGDNVLAVEDLRVAATTVAGREILLASCWAGNHASRSSSPEVVRRLYPDSTPDSDFIAIWFE